MSLTYRNRNSAAPGSKDRSSARSAGSGEIEPIRVAIRLKPLPEASNTDVHSRAWEVLQDSKTIIPLADPSKPVAATAASNSQGAFTFDQVYGENSTTTQIYEEMVKSIVDSVTLRGINGTVFAYGQTSSGKTFTMQGSCPTISEVDAVSPRPHKKLKKQKGKEEEASRTESSQPVDGITQMAARDIFACISKDTEHTYVVRVSFMEIYNEGVFDLLVGGNANDQLCDGGGGGSGPNRSSSRTALDVRKHPKKGFFVENLTSHRVDNLDTLLNYLNIGERHKSMAATEMNDRSSRSHTIFRITVVRTKKFGVGGASGAAAAKPSGVGVAGNEDGGHATGKAASHKAGGGAPVKLVATLNLVDLAGSESVKHTGAIGRRQREAGNISQSLLTLSKVIMGLGNAGKGGKPFVNYRDSKLTLILKNSLSGHARMAMICCATPSGAYSEETKSTLQFASRAKLVKTRAAVNKVNEDPSVIKPLQREVAQRSEEGKRALRQQQLEFEQSAKDAEKAAADAKKVEKLQGFIARNVFSETDMLLPQKRKRGDVPPTRNCSYKLPKPSTDRPFAKTRSCSLGGPPTNLNVDNFVSTTIESSSSVSPRYAEALSKFDRPSTEVTILKDALAAKTTQICYLTEKSREVDSEALDTLKKGKDSLQAQVDRLTSEKKVALDWNEELLSQADKKDNELKEALFEIGELQQKFEVYEERQRKVQLELDEAKDTISRQEKCLSTARQVATGKDEASSATKEPHQRKDTLPESPGDLSVDIQEETNELVLQNFEEPTGAIDANPELDGECRQMTSENQGPHLNSSLHCQGDSDMSSGDELFAFDRPDGSDMSSGDELFAFECLKPDDVSSVTRSASATDAVIGSASVRPTVDPSPSNGGSNTWDQRFEELKQYKKVHGHCNVPQKWEENKPLGSWVNRQRKAYRLLQEGKQSAMTDDRVACLENIGFEWSLKTDWDLRFDELKQYKKIHGHCNVPKSRKENEPLATWVKTQRSQYRLLQEGRQSPMTDDRIAKLESLGFIWSVRTLTDWGDRFDELNQYKVNHGDCNVPKSWKENKQLGLWVYHQRRQYRLLQEGKQSAITDDRIACLESIGFEWSLYTDWDLRFDELKQYKVEHRDCNVPRSWEENKRLGKWVDKQRSQYRLLEEGSSSSLTDERVTKLESIGFRWSLR